MFGEYRSTRGTASPVLDDDGPPLFRVLGSVEILGQERPFIPRARKVHQLLALFLLRAGRVVHTDMLINELWPERLPRSARSTAQTYVYQLRRALETSGLPGSGDELLVTKAPGYILRIPEQRIDVYRFRALAARGRAAMDDRRHEDAARLFREALDLWSEQPVADVNCGPLLTAHVLDLNEQRRNVRQLRIQAEIEAGMHHEVIGELRSLAADNPLDEGLHGQLMRVLGRSGRRGDALDTYQNIRSALVEQLGLEPNAELRRLHQELLTAD